VQPVKRRYVVVPYDGRLEAALDEPGDLVAVGQTLALMDGREIQWELGTLNAELKRAEKNHDTALAAHETAQAQMARLEAERLRLKIRLLEERLGNLEIKSPIAGIVIGGDPKESAGARLTMGQTILEVGPLDEMAVELSIPEEDIAHVQLGQQVRFRLTAHPLRTYDGTIDRIHPRAETRDTENVFVAQVKVCNADASLRPGMEGSAKIATARHAWGWNLFHKAWDSVLFRCGW
jgi:multidrug resistance efflux pump